MMCQHDVLAHVDHNMLAAGLEWEEIESSEGPALMSLQPGAVNGQVSMHF